MKLTRKVFLMALLMIFFLQHGAMALDPLYERNGTAFLLVSDNNHNQDPLDGVYQANRTSSGIPEKRFYPGLTYGIGVNLNLHINTFSEAKDNNWVNYTGPQEKIVNWKQTDGYFTGQAWGHRCVHQPQGWGRIPGSHGHFPCERGVHAAGTWAILNNAVGGDTGFKRMRIPSGQWYHCTEPAALGWPAPGGWMAANETLPHPFSNPNPYFYTSRSWKMFRDVEKRKYHKYYRHTWKPGDGAGIPPRGPKVAESFEVDITRYIRNGCFDGCGIAQSVVPLPADKWLTSMVFNRHSKSYFYARKVGATSAYIDINGVRHDSYPVVGSMFNLTSENIGVSMKSNSEDYVYVLGKDVANNWLSNYYGYPVNIDFGGSVVSDQWWMKGGTVFFYDRNTGRIYQIERDEGLPNVPGDTYASSKIENIFVHSGLGSDIDAIAADGFGNLFYTKTHYVPESKMNFTYPMRESVSWGSDSGEIRPGTVTYRQNIYKTVFKKDISGIQSEEGQLLIGHRLFNQNIQYEPYSASADLSNEDNWKKNSDPYLVFTSVATIERAELAVVNVATPPNVSGEKVANLDINGPFSDAGDGDYRSAQPANDLSPTEVYKFEIENYPLHNGKVNRRVFTDPAVEERFRRIDRHSGTIGTTNNFIGGFVSTLRVLGSENDECVRYTWRVFRTVDAANQPLPERQLIYERGTDGNYFRPYIFASFDYGEYDIEVSANYQWYDADLLAYGSTVASLSEVLRNGVALAADGTTVARMSIVVKGAMPELESVANIRIMREKSINNWVAQDASEGGAFGNYFVTDEFATDKWRVDDPNSSQLVKAIRGTEPPHPGDPHMRPNSLRWLEPSIQANWSARILNPTTLNYADYYTPPDSEQAIGSSKQQTLTQINPAFPSASDNEFYMETGNGDGPNKWAGAFTIPSDPGLYELRCSMRRQILWETIPITYEEDIMGNLVAVPGDPQPRSKSVELEGIVKVLVKDLTPPNIDMAEVSHKFLYAETRGSIGQAVDGKNPNPDQIIITVPDNNPMAYLNWERPSSIRRHEFGTQRATVTYQARSDGSFVALADHDIVLTGLNVEVEPLDFGSVYRIVIDKAKFNKQMPMHKAIRTRDVVAESATITIDDLEMDPLYFGIAQITDTSSNSVTKTPYMPLGEILLIDTIRPNLVLSIHDEKHDMTRYAPDSTELGTSNSYAFIDDREIWVGHPTASNLGNITLNGPTFGPVHARFQESANELLEVDSPITFRVRGVDNITDRSNIRYEWFRLQRVEPTSGLPETLETNPHRQIFRMDAGGSTETWSLSAKLSDRAVGLPSSLYYQDPYNVNAAYPHAYRSRTLNDARFIIHNTTLDVRVIDRHQR